VAIDVKEMTGAGDFAGGSDERYLQTLSFSYRVTLKEQSHTLLVLRHESRLPASPAPFVEEIGERVLIFAGMTSQLDDNSLVFFHREIEIMSR